jgi:hypothetical protein
LKIAIILACAVALTGCGEVSPETKELYRQSNQRAIMALPIVCRDGVQFYVTHGSHGEIGFVHRQRPDGSNYRCASRPVVVDPVAPTLMQEVPVE